MDCMTRLDALLGHADLVAPDGICFVVVLENCGPTRVPCGEGLSRVSPMQGKLQMMGRVGGVVPETQMRLGSMLSSLVLKSQAMAMASDLK